MNHSRLSKIIIKTLIKFEKATKVNNKGVEYGKSRTYQATI